MESRETQLIAAARSATAANIMDDAIVDYENGIGHDVRLTDFILARLRANGYVITRRVPPCRAHDFEDNNDAA